jgi:hypothetical protein
MSCLPGTPCYNAYYQPSENCGCSECITTSNNITYIGPNLPNLGVTTGECLTTILQKIDNELNSTVITQNVLSTILLSPSLSILFCTLVSNCTSTTSTTSTTTTIVI